MKHNLTLDFSVDKENKTINVKREFAANRSLVWNAYTTSEILDQWWAPRPWKARTKAMDFRDGGQWLYAMVGPEGEEHWSIANYSNIRKPEGFNVLDGFTDANGTINQEMPQSNWKVSFNEKGGNTLVGLNITFDDLSQLEATLSMGFKEGLLSAMDNLDELLEAKK